MGTSQSNKGSPPGVPMVPSWVPNISASGGQAGDIGGGDQSDAQQSPYQVPDEQPQQTIPVAPPARFASAKINLGNFVRSSDNASMRKGIGRYVKKGYGGSSTTTKRLGSTIQAAQALYSALTSGAENQYAIEGGALDPKLLAGKTAYEVMDAVVEAVRPVDGTQDTEACRAAIKDALSDVLTIYPGADLANLTEEQRAIAIERYVAGDVFRRIDLDLGKYVRDKASSATVAMSRLKEIREYVRETVTASFKKINSTGQKLTGNTVSQVVQNAIRETCDVFEGYAE